MVFIHSFTSQQQTYPVEFVPLSPVDHEILQLTDGLECIHALIQKECGVIHEHVHKLDKVTA